MALTSDEIDLLVTSGPASDDDPEVTPSPVHTAAGLPRLKAYGST
jgi:hypothetical protein